MGTLLKRAAMMVAAGLLLGGCAAAGPWRERHEAAMLLDASAHADARVMMKPEQLFDE